MIDNDRNVEIKNSSGNGYRCESELRGFYHHLHEVDASKKYSKIWKSNSLKSMSSPNPNNAICINGASTRLSCIGDKVIVMSHQMCTEKKGDEYCPTIVLVDGIIE